MKRYDYNKDKNVSGGGWSVTANDLLTNKEGNDKTVKTWTGKSPERYLCEKHDTGEVSKLISENWAEFDFETGDFLLKKTENNDPQTETEVLSHVFELVTIMDWILHGFDVMEKAQVEMEKVIASAHEDAYNGEMDYGV